MSSVEPGDPGNESRMTIPHFLIFAKLTLVSAFVLQLWFKSRGGQLVSIDSCVCGKHLL